MTATYDRLKATHPDRVGQAGYWADLDGYRVEVNDTGFIRWALHSHTGRYPTGKYISSGMAPTVDAAWRAGCDALDEQHTLTAQLAELDEAS